MTSDRAQGGASAAFRSRPLDGNPYPYLWLDALAVKVREGGHIVRVAVVLATAVNGEGQREILGLDAFTSEDEAAWSVVLAELVERGLRGVQLVISDDHRGLTRAIDALLPGAAWQRCRTHFMRNLLARVPKSAQPFVPTLARSIFAQPSAAEVAAQLARACEQLARRQTSPRLSPSPSPAGGRSGPTTPSSASTVRSAVEATWSASSPTERR